MGLLRCEEHIRFEALAEVPMREDTSEDTHENLGAKLVEALQITHRIANTQEISMQTFDVQRNYRELRIKVIATLGLFILYIGGGYFIWVVAREILTLFLIISIIGFTILISLLLVFIYLHRRMKKRFNALFRK
jgi:hypothetical protein